MSKYTIAWMPGDGVGNDVMRATRIVLDKLGLDAEYVHADIGWEFWIKEGNPLPERTIEILKKTDCALFGAITSKPREEAAEELDPALRDKGLTYFSPIVRLRQLFNLHTNLRPCEAFKGNPLNRLGDDIDLVVFRENTEGMYGGIEWFPLPEKIATAMADPEVGLPDRMQRWFDKGLENVALSTRVVSRQGCESICRQSFEYAKKFGRKSVTLVEKPNVLRETGGLMTRVFREVAKDYPGVEAWEANIDAICMWMLKNPQDYDVLVAENMFGDIVSDLCAGLVGGLGFAPAANIGDEYAVFEPTHGSAPKYDGKDVVNPIAMLLTAKMMLDWLGEADMADRLHSAISAVIEAGEVRTYDMAQVRAGSAGAASTTEMAKAVAARL
ncbi:MAG: isocitrate/isopropylmalate dehydrogenase family protein [Planctomycetota bacterium]|nr:isocitrate/isopropylmalate dehydrogenase family protein [Planctomycetota bacterium]